MARPILGVVALLGLGGGARADTGAAPCDPASLTWKSPGFCLVLPGGWSAVPRKKGAKEPSVTWTLSGELHPGEPFLKVSWLPAAKRTFDQRVREVLAGVRAYRIIRETTRDAFRAFRIDDTGGMRVVAVLGSSGHLLTCEAWPGTRVLAPDALAACESLAVPGSAALPRAVPAESDEPDASYDPSIRLKAERGTELHAKKRQVVIPDAWRACKRVSECSFLWEPCLADAHLAVNKRSVKRTKKMVADACRGLSWVGGEPDDVSLVCEAKRCAVKK